MITILLTLIVIFFFIRWIVRLIRKKPEQSKNTFKSGFKWFFIITFKVFSIVTMYLFNAVTSTSNNKCGRCGAQTSSFAVCDDCGYEIEREENEVWEEYMNDD